MKINRDNYEAYFLDYHEGQLSPEMSEEVLLFVEMNPDLMNVFDEFEAVTLDTEQNIVFENKAGLKKNQVFATSQVNESNYEEFLISETEGLLNTQQLASLEEFISINPQFEKDRRLYALTHLAIENEIVFEAKDSLKQKAIPAGAITAETFETYMARELEGDLNPEEALQFAEFMKYNPHLAKDLVIYKHTILKPENEIVFEGKDKLKHTIIPIRRLVYYALSAAASLALVMSFYFLLDRNQIPQNIVQQDNVKQKLEQKIQTPAPVIPGNQVAVNNQQEIIRIKEKTNNNSNISSPENNAENTTEITTQADFPERSAIEPIKARQANKVRTRNHVDAQFTFIRVSQMYINQHLEFYYNLKLAEEIQYAELNTKDDNPAKTLFKAATGKVGSLFASRQSTPTKEENKGFSMWTLAELGVQTLNTVTSSEMELKLKKDDEGKVVGYDLESGLFNVEKDLKK
jgi:hypothetical protein